MILVLKHVLMGKGKLSANAVIIGNIHIGNNCRIGAGATVAVDVPDNCIVVSQMPRIIHMKES